MVDFMLVIVIFSFQQIQYIQSTGSIVSDCIEYYWEQTG